MEDIVKNDENNISSIDQEENTQTQSSENTSLYLTFYLGNDLFGIHVNRVREVIEYKQIFKVPRVPEFIKGVINLRGEVVPVVDLHSRFYDSPCDTTKRASIVIVEIDDENNRIPIGIIINMVEAVTEISVEDIDSVPEIGNKIRSDYIDGIGKCEGVFVTLLRAQNILNIEELANNSEIHV